MKTAAAATAAAATGIASPGAARWTRLRRSLPRRAQKTGPVNGRRVKTVDVHAHA